MTINKSMVANMIFGSIGFVLAGVWFMISPPNINNPIFGNQVLLFVVGLISFLFFGFIGFTMLLKLIANKPGILITNEGLYNNSGGFSEIYIPWSDVKAIKENNVSNQLLIDVIVSKPMFYVDSEKNFIKKYMLQKNLKKYDSVCSISSNTLNCNHFELKELLEKSFDEFKKENTDA